MTTTEHPCANTPEGIPGPVPTCTREAGHNGSHQEASALTDDARIEAIRYGYRQGYADAKAGLSYGPPR